MAKKSDSRPASGRVPFAKKSLGQNFLVDGSVVRRIVQSLGPAPGDRVVEIGPGRGALTDLLAESGAEVLAIELDRVLAAELGERYAAAENVTVIEADALGFDFGSLTSGGRLKLVANLPYYISTPILRRLCAARECFSALTVMVQKEVAERILARPRESERGFLTVLLERGFESEYLFTVPPGAFRPVPKVTSAVIRLLPRAAGEVAATDEQFEALAGAAFSQKRKTLRNNLLGAPGELKELIEKKGGIEEIIARTGLRPSVRAEELAKDEWERLAEAIFS